MAVAKALLIAILATTHWVTSPVLSNPTAQRFRREISQRLSQSSMQMSASSTPCRDAGYMTGCCENGYCYVFSSDCFCDSECYNYFDCCQDINDIGCSPPDESTSMLLSNSQQTPVGEASCPDNLTLTNGEISYSSPTSPWRPGTVATYSCSNSYALFGSLTRVCQQNSTWNGSESECRKTCDELGTLTNGRITYEPPYSTSSRKPLRTVATYSCNEGYVLNLDIRKRVCEEVEDSQGWSGASDTSSAQCIARSCQLAEFRGNRNVKSCCREPIRYYCTIGPPQSDVECSCSLLTCIAEGNCCPDIDRECVPETCSEAGLPNNGCCSWENSEGCYVPGGNCYCDQECHRWNDCCPGVGNCTTSSSSRAASQIYIGHESVRTKLYSAQARLASQRLRGGQKSRKFDDQAVVRELASELRSMSQVQELSNQQQRAQWETILSELQEIQKTKN